MGIARKTVLGKAATGGGIKGAIAKTTLGAANKRFSGGGGDPFAAMAAAAAAKRQAEAKAKRQRIKADTNPEDTRRSDLVAAKNKAAQAEQRQVSQARAASARPTNPSTYTPPATPAATPAARRAAKGRMAPMQRSPNTGKLGRMRTGPGYDGSGINPGARIGRGMNSFTGRSGGSIRGAAAGGFGPAVRPARNMNRPVREMNMDSRFGTMARRMRRA